MAASAVHVELLGGFAVLTAGRPCARAPSTRQQELLAFLMLHARAAPLARRRVAGSLWPDSTDAQALTNLRRELHHLREEWPGLDALVETTARTLAWRDQSNASVDLAAFEAAAERGLGGDEAALTEAARLYKGDLLPDCAAQWIESDRQRFRALASAVLARLAGLLEGNRAFGEALECLRHLLRLDPLDEPAWCALMRCHARRGERATALHLYQQCAALFRKELGVEPSAATRQTYREVLELDEVAAVVPPPARPNMYRLVGRALEWEALLGAWREAAAGRPRLCLIRGEAGIGKTRLAEELVDWCERSRVRVLSARCYAGEGGLAYAPIAVWLKDGAVQPALARLNAASLADVARLYPGVVAARPEVSQPTRQLQTWERLRFFESLAQAFRSAAPLVLILDDLQWADTDTVEWLWYFLHSAAGTRCLVVGTGRSEEEQDNPALGRLIDRLERDGQLSVIRPGPLDQAATAQLAGEVAGRSLDEQTSARLFRETEGHPLFIVERGYMESVREPGDPAGAVVSQVQAVVAARMALLSDEARTTAEVAAAVGRDFGFDILAEAADLEEDALVRALDELWRRHVVRAQSDERWDFSHDRIREVTYSTLSPARRRLIHRRIAQAMERLHAHRLDDVSASVALHLDRGGRPAPAVPFLARAAEVAMRVTANEEAIRCLTYALSLLERLPSGRDRDDRELSLRSSLSVAFNAARGYAAPDVERNLDRVFELYRGGHGGQVPVRWLWVAFTLRFVLGEVRRARALSEEALAGSAFNPSFRCEAHHAMAATSLTSGELEAANQHFEAALAAHDERQPRRSPLGSDLGVFVHAWQAQVVWLLGDEPAALAHADQALALARRLDHPFSETLAFAYAGMLHQMRRDAAAVLECADAVVSLCGRHGFAYYGDWAEVLRGWARGQREPASGIPAIESALARLDVQRAQARRPYYLSLLAETYRLAGDRHQAASTIEAAIGMAIERSDVWWLPALYLERSRLEPSPQRDATLRQALELAQTQGSRALEHRILTSSTPEPA